MFPTVVLIKAEIDLHERTPLRTFRLADEMYLRFLRRAIGLLRIALDAGANNIFPGRWPATVARNDVIQIQILAVENPAAILAGVFIALKNIVARELDFLFRQPVEHHQQNHPRNADAKRNGLNRFRMRLLPGEVVPLAETISLERAVAAAEHSLRVPLKQKRQRPACGADIDRLPEAIEDEHVLIEH